MSTNFKRDKREMQMWSLLSAMRVHSIEDDKKYSLAIASFLSVNTCPNH